MPRWLWKICVVLGMPRFSGPAPTINTVSFFSRKCKKSVLLSGKYFSAPGSNSCIIIVQGYSRHWGDTEIGLPEIIKFLVKQGFNVLILDLRARGESNGRKVSLYYETYDLLGARDFLVNEKKIQPSKIGLIGFSYGGTVCILAASEGDFGAIALDSALSDMLGYLKAVLGRYHLLFLQKAVKAIVRFILGLDMEKSNARKAVKSISAPIFAIYGKNDRYLFTSVRELFFLKKSHALDSEWPTDAPHCRSYALYPKEYLERVGEFFEKSLKPTCQK